MKTLNQNGFGHLGIIVAVVVVLVIGVAGWRVMQSSKNKTHNATASVQGTPTAEQQATQQPQQSTLIRWDTDGSGNWRALDPSPPTCPAQPMLKAPADLSKATSILYPGQTRGDNYKPHGGFRFDGTANDKITVTAPMDGYVARGARYLAEGSIQYTFDFINSCGVMVRLGHLLVLTPKFAILAEKFPPAQEGDSRTERVEQGITVKAGDQIATAVGIAASQNTFFDMGVYDLRMANEASKDTSYVQKYGMELAGHAVCWFDWLPSSDATRVHSLPAGDPTSGKKSDYCK